MKTRVAGWGLLLLLAVGLAGCRHGGQTAYALTATGSLLQFSTDKPGKIEAEHALTGLSSGQSVVQMQFRPADGRLYGLTNDARLCLIDPTTGAVTLIGSGSFSSSTLADPQMDFDPVAGDLRVIATDQNLRVFPDTGALESSNTKVAYANGDPNFNVTPNLAGIAYDHNRAGASTTTLYAIDQSSQSLVRVGSFGGSPNSPDSGLLFTVGRLGTSFGNNDGFDIDGRGTAYALLAPAGAGASLYTLDLASGAVTKVGALDNGQRAVIALAVAPD